MLKTNLLPLLAAALLASASPVWAAGELTYVVNNESAKYDPGTTAETFATPIIGNAFEGLGQIRIGRRHRAGARRKLDDQR